VHSDNQSANHNIPLREHAKVAVVVAYQGHIYYSSLGHGLLPTNLQSTITSLYTEGRSLSDLFTKCQRHEVSKSLRQPNDKHLFTC
jgi:hypothetical protein